jgi:hypothetical protein
MGVWRLETKGYYATAELMGTLDMLQMAGQEHSIIEAVLRLEQRTVKRAGKGEGKGTLKFAVPVLWPKYTPRQMLAGAAHVLLAAPPAPAQTLLTEAITDLYGEQHETDDPLVARINALLIEEGVDAEARAAWWAKKDARYPQRSAFTLTKMYDELREAADKKRMNASYTPQDALGGTNAREGDLPLTAAQEAPSASQEPIEATADFSPDEESATL